MTAQSNSVDAAKVKPAVGLDVPPASQMQNAASGDVASQIASIRTQNLRSLQRARFGISPDYRFLESALTLGDQSLIAECRLCRACAKSGSSRPGAARDFLSLVLSQVEKGLVLEPLWAWRYENTAAVVTAAFSQSDRSWEHHSQSLVIAKEMGNGELIGISEINLAHDLIRTGMTTEALFRLSAALATPGLADTTAAGIQLILAHLADQQGDESRAQSHRDVAEDFALRAEPLQYSKLLVLMADLALRFGDQPAARRHVEEFRRASEASGSSLAMLDYGVFQARLHQLCGEQQEALACVQRVLAQGEKGLTVQVDALVLACQLQVEVFEFDLALETLSHESLASAGPFFELEIAKTKRLALEGLGQWEQAAGMSDQIRMLTRDRAVDLQAVYERQVLSGQNAEIRSQTRSLQVANEALRDLSLDNEEIISMISNNLQSPLTTLRLVVELMRSEPTAAAILRHLALAHRSILRLSGVVQQLVLAGELEAGMVVPERERIDLVELLRNVDLAQRARLEDRSMSLVQSLDADTRYVDVDSTRLEQLLDAVISGVVEFSPADSEVGLIVERCGSGLVELRIEAAQMALSEGTVRQLRRNRPNRAPEGASAGIYSDLSFYLAEELSLAMETPLRVEHLGDSGLSFSVVVSGA